MLSPDKSMEVLKKHMLIDGFDIMMDMDRSLGNRIVDGRTGRSFLDMFSMFASQPLGINHPALTEESFLRRLGKAAVNNPTNSDIYNPEMAEFVDTFMKLAAPASMKHLFLVAGGALAVENALKVAFDWKVQKNFQKGYKEEKGHKVVHFRECFHGRSGYTLSLTNTDPSKTKYFPKFEWPRIDNPKVSFPLEGNNLEKVKAAEQAALAQLKQAIHDNKDEIAALIIEPIQGEGGDNHFRGEFLKALRQVCDESEIFYILDEVQTGIGLTGKWWCYQHFGFEPDAFAFGKKMQVCGILVSDRVDEVEKNCFVASSRINSTWGGNVVDMVRSSQYLKVIDREKLIDKAAAHGEHLVSSLETLQKEAPDLLTNARGRGMMAAIDLVDPARRPALIKKMLEEGLMILPSGTHSIRFRPSLITTLEELDEAVDILRRSVKAVFASTAAR